MLQSGHVASCRPDHKPSPSRGHIFTVFHHSHIWLTDWLTHVHSGQKWKYWKDSIWRWRWFSDKVTLSTFATNLILLQWPSLDNLCLNWSLWSCITEKVWWQTGEYFKQNSSSRFVQISSSLKNMILYYIIAHLCLKHKSMLISWWNLKGLALNPNSSSFCCIIGLFLNWQILCNWSYCSELSCQLVWSVPCRFKGPLQAEEVGELEVEIHF